MIALAAAVVPQDDPLLALLFAVTTPRGAGWGVVLAGSAVWLFRSGRAARALGWVKGAFRTVDTLTGVAASVSAVKADVEQVDQRLTAHLADADQRHALTTTSVAALAERVGESREDMREIRSRLDEVVLLGREVRHEVRNNGGSSVKDSTHRIERALGLPEPTREGEALPTGPIVVPTP